MYTFQQLPELSGYEILNPNGNPVATAYNVKDAETITAALNKYKRIKV